MIGEYLTDKINRAGRVLQDSLIGTKSIGKDFLRGTTAVPGSVLFMPSAVRKFKESYGGLRKDNYFFVVQENIARSLGVVGGLVLTVKTSPGIYHFFKEHPIAGTTLLVATNVLSAGYERCRKEKGLESKL